MSGIAARIRKDLSEKLKGRDIKTATVEYTIREGKPAENIVNFAQSENIDLLIISTHGSSGLSRWNISSITQKVLNLVYLPVLIVRAYNQPEFDGTGCMYHHILLPIDSSRRAECSLSAGIALAGKNAPEQVTAKGGDVSAHQTPTNDASHQTKLILAAVIKPPEIPIPEPYPVEIERLSENLMQVSRQAVSTYLEEMKERLPVESEICVVESNSVSSAIQKLANHEKEIDLVVLCAHGHTGEPAWPYGSVTRNYIEHGIKTVLIIQDIHRSQVRPTAAEVASENSGGR
jgi:nucleotide-binding universal stress UspA family protein